MSSQEPFRDILVRVCRRFIQRVTTLHDELLQLEFLLDSDECAEYRARAAGLAESLFGDLYLVFGPTVLDEPLGRAIDSLFDAVWEFEQLIDQTIEQMWGATRDQGRASGVQDCVDADLREEIDQLVVRLKGLAKDVIRLGARFAHDFEDIGRAEDEPLH